jgi:hypothetical protein
MAFPSGFQKRPSSAIILGLDPRTGLSVGTTSIMQGTQPGAFLGTSPEMTAEGRGRKVRLN